MTKSTRARLSNEQKATIFQDAANSLEAAEQTFRTKKEVYKWMVTDVDVVKTAVGGDQPKLENLLSNHHKGLVTSYLGNDERRVDTLYYSLYLSRGKELRQSRMAFFKASHRVGEPGDE
jgi:hypothetical protein